MTQVLFRYHQLIFGQANFETSMFLKLFNFRICFKLYRYGGRERLVGRRESPYLMFEITSEDGFHVRCESWDGMFKLCNTMHLLDGHLSFSASLQSKLLI